MNSVFDGQSDTMTCHSSASSQGFYSLQSTPNTKSYCVSGGKIVFLKVQKINDLGKGEFGCVKLVNVLLVPSDPFYLNSPQNMAMKVITLENQESRVEESIMKRLYGSHPNLIDLHYFFIYKNPKLNLVHECLIMELMPEDMLAMIKRLTSKKIYLDESVIRLFSKQLLSGLEFLHQLSIVHRDIAPKNILVDMDNFQLKVADFGSAKVLIPGNENSVIVGTAFYRAPELLFKISTYGTCVDIWSAACVICYMVCRKHIFYFKGNEHLFPIFEIIGEPILNEQCDAISNNPNSVNVLAMLIKNEKLSSLLNLMFNYDHNKRITASEALKHPYFMNKN